MNAKVYVFEDIFASLLMKCIQTYHADIRFFFKISTGEQPDKIVYRFSLTLTNVSYESSNNIS